MIERNKRRLFGAFVICFMLSISLLLVGCGKNKNNDNDDDGAGLSNMSLAEARVFVDKVYNDVCDTTSVKSETFKRLNFQDYQNPYDKDEINILYPVHDYFLFFLRNIINIDEAEEHSFFRIEMQRDDDDMPDGAQEEHFIYFHFELTSTKVKWYFREVRCFSDENNDEYYDMDFNMLAILVNLGEGDWEMEYYVNNVSTYGDSVLYNYQKSYLGFFDNKFTHYKYADATLNEEYDVVSDINAGGLTFDIMYYECSLTYEIDFNYNFIDNIEFALELACQLFADVTAVDFSVFDDLQNVNFVDIDIEIAFEYYD